MTAPSALPTASPDALIVLIVDDVPDNVALLHDALDEAGHTVLVALNGQSALQRAADAMPDVVLLDALMPGMDGFEVARRLKANAQTQHIPIIFMTGLTEAEHVVAALEAGGSDYVTKPIRVSEILARMAVHLRTARREREAQREQHQTRNALDAFGYASLTLRGRDGQILWQTPLARQLLQRYSDAPPGATPEPLRQWFVRQLQQLPPDHRPWPEPPRLTLTQGQSTLTFRLHQRVGDADEHPGDDHWLVVMQESSNASTQQQLASVFALTNREAEVLYWVAKGKINRDIADIVGASPATVKKHLERIHAKLGVETRTAAAAMALARVAALKG
jgi:DNA-binding response OmpR family regulator/DNA-binding CsgD family transcriptional regulator